MGVTWYLSCDMQMYWLSPLVILPIWFNERIGLAFWATCLAGFTALQGYMTGYFRFGPVIDLQ